MMQRKPFGVETVKERLAKLQKQNFRSIPEKQEPQQRPIDREIEEFKQKSLIMPTPLEGMPSSKVRRRLENLGDDFFEVPLPPERDNFNEEAMAKEIPELEGPYLDRIKVALGKIQDIKKKMKDTDNYLGLYYDLKKAEDELASTIDDSLGAKVKIPEKVMAQVDSLMPRR